MKFALIGDIHGNLPALKSVYAHIKTQNVLSVFNIGDSVGFGPYPNEVITFLKAHSILSILGNYDDKVLLFPSKKSKWKKNKHPLKYLAFKWTYNKLSSMGLSYLSSLPKEIRLNIYDYRILLTHASPDSDEEHLTPDTPRERFKKLARTSASDIVVFGHSHIPFHHKENNVTFINTGSVGRQDDGNPEASYAIIDIRKNRLKIHHYRLSYNTRTVENKIKTEKLPPEYAKMFRLGVNLDMVLSKD